MKTHVRLYLKVCLLLFSFGPAAASSQPGDSHGKLKVDGVKRSYLLHVPMTYQKDKPLPLVLVLHGAFGNAKVSRWDSRMSEQSENDGFIVAYPSAKQGTWNAGLCCGLSQRKNVDDIAFVSALIKELSQNFNIDKKRIYAAGVSNGGMLAYKIARELSSEFAAIAAVETCMYPSQQAGGPISLIAIHGTSDPVIPYKGGAGSWFGYKLKVPSVNDTIQYWIKQNGCNSKTQKDQKGKICKELYSQGESNTEVCLYTLEDGGHIWPGGRRAKLTGNKIEKEFSATETICEFFLSHPKP